MLVVEKHLPSRLSKLACKQKKEKFVNDALKYSNILSRSLKKNETLDYMYCSEVIKLVKPPTHYSGIEVTPVVSAWCLPVCISCNNVE